MQDLQKEYDFLAEQASMVYETVTGNALSKVSYTADTVISAYNENCDVVFKGRLEDGLGDMVNDGIITEEVKAIIIEGFDKYI